MKKAIFNKIIKICIFLVIANLPFLTVVQTIGINSFLDSFQHPDTYRWIKNYENDNDTKGGGYIILQRPTHQDLNIKNGDTILYQTFEGSVKCEPVLDVELRQGATVYYTTTPAQDDIKGPIYDTQILGKVTDIVDNNIWNAFCLQIWDFSIKNLNANEYFGNTQPIDNVS
jgi:hypothetical protein